MEEEGFAVPSVEVTTLRRDDCPAVECTNAPSLLASLRVPRMQPQWLHKVPNKLASARADRGLCPPSLQDQGLSSWLLKNAPVLVYRRCTQGQIHYNQNNVVLPELPCPPVVSSLRPADDSASSQPTFDSLFEGGNLRLAFRGAREFEYNLVLNQDTNTAGYCQWFYFSVAGVPQGQVLVLNILNMLRGGYLFGRGMRPVACTRERGWYQLQGPIQFSPNGLLSHQGDPLNTLSFTARSPQKGSKLYIASHLPYTYSRLLKSIQSLDKNLPFHSLSLNKLPVLVFGTKKKPVVLVIARQHPVQVCSSYLAESLVRQLAEQSALHQELLAHCSVWVVPMVNVDGVIVGNTRCDLTGLDLNRQWRNPYQQYQPQIAAIKSLLFKLKPRLFIDLHGHSKALNSFAYSCCSPTLKRLVRHLAKIQPRFSWKQSSFALSPDKEATARGVAFREAKSDALTLEVSIFGTDHSGVALAWTQQDYTSIAGSLLESVRFVLRSKSFQGIDAQIQSQLKQLGDQDSSDSQAQTRLNHRLKEQLDSLIHEKKKGKPPQRRPAFNVKRNRQAKQLSIGKSEPQKSETQASNSPSHPMRSRRLTQFQESQVRGRVRERSMSEMDSKALQSKDLVKEASQIEERIEQQVTRKEKTARLGELRVAKPARYKQLQAAALLHGIEKLKSRAANLNNEYLQNALLKEQRRVKERMTQAESRRWKPNIFIKEELMDSFQF